MPASSQAPVQPHTHFAIEPQVISTREGIQAVKWSFFGLAFTALLQLLVVFITGSVALLADAIHNFGDAFTAVPLLAAFILSTWKPDDKFTFGYGRVEDLAGVFVIIMIFISAVLAGFVSIQRLFHPEGVSLPGAVALAAGIGFVGNELVARLRIHVGKKIGSAALVADGVHARADGFTSLSVLLGALGVYLGFPVADPIIGIGITIAILFFAYDTGKIVLLRLLDAVDPSIPGHLRLIAVQIPGVLAIPEVRVRWIGHRLFAELTITVNATLTVIEGHALAREVRHELLHHLRYLSDVTVHVDPSTESGPEYHTDTENHRLPPDYRRIQKI